MALLRTSNGSPFLVEHAEYRVRPGGQHGIRQFQLGSWPATSHRKSERARVPRGRREVRPYRDPSPLAQPASAGGIQAENRHERILGVSPRHMTHRAPQGRAFTLKSKLCSAGHRTYIAMFPPLDHLPPIPFLSGGLKLEKHYIHDNALKRQRKRSLIRYQAEARLEQTDCFMENTTWAAFCCQVKTLTSWIQMPRPHGVCTRPLYARQFHYTSCRMF